MNGHRDGVPIEAELLGEVGHREAEFQEPLFRSQGEIGLWGPLWRVSTCRHHLPSSNPVGKQVNLKINSQMEFREKLLKLRKDLDLTQEDMGARLGVSGNWISLLELGKKDPAAATLNHVELLIEAVEAGILAAPGRAPNLRVVSRPALTENEEPKTMAGREGDEPPPYGARTRLVPLVSWAHAGSAESYEELPTSWQEQVAAIRRPLRCD
jgi:transcriptional regulator with XRE-family HTH domain